MRVLPRALLAGALVLAAPGPGAAHSLLLEASPTPGTVLAAAPMRVTLRFNNRIEKALSGIRLLDGRGPARALALAPAEGGADRLSAPLPPLGPGGYRVEWHVLSTDGHVVRGGFAFRIAP